MAKRKALGRGLSALIPATEKQEERSGPREYFVCPIHKIVPGANQPRKTFNDRRLDELAASIAEKGVIEPLVVRSLSDGNFQLIAGERRWRAAQKASVHDVPVVIRQVSDIEAIEMALVENIQREDLNPLEEAEAMSGLIEECDYTQEQLAQRLGKERSTVANTLRLLKLPAEAKEALLAGYIKAGHARSLLGLDEPRLMLQALEKVLAAGLSVRQTEALVKRMREPPAPPPPREASSPNVRDLQERLCKSLKTPVKLVSRKNNRGRIEIAYGSLDELDRLLEILFR